jgi:DNA-binding transcriptional MerR regulator
MGTAAELLGAQPAFLRSLDAAGLLSPGRSAGGQRRYSRADLTLATRVRALLDQNMPLAAATRIVSLEHQLGVLVRLVPGSTNGGHVHVERLHHGHQLGAVHVPDGQRWRGHVCDVGGAGT